jgi:hypothetical protein
LFLGISLLKSNGEVTSVIGIKRCDINDWALFVLLQWLCIIFTWLGSRVLQSEYKEKVQCSYDFTDGDLKATGSKLLCFQAIAFIGAFGTAFCGSGPGAIFAPMLIMVDIHPDVALVTAIYLAMLTTLCATIQEIVYDKLNLQYSLYICIFTFLGTLPGVFFQRYIMVTTGRNSIVLLIGIILLSIAALSTGTNGVISTLADIKNDLNLLEMSKFCNMD